MAISHRKMASRQGQEARPFDTTRNPSPLGDRECHTAMTKDDGIQYKNNTIMNINIFNLMSQWLVKLLQLLTGGQSTTVPTNSSSSSVDSEDDRESDSYDTNLDAEHSSVSSGISNTTNESTTSESTKEENPMNKKALCVGINDYPGGSNDLSGCVNDCNDWATLLQSEYGFTQVVKLINAQATRSAITQALSALVNGSKAGDVLVFSYSGHGSYIVDTSKDEPDGKDETLYAYDGNIIDDELRAILNRLPAGVNMTVILDSCHSGTATRFSHPNAPKVRFMPPKDAKTAQLGILPSNKNMLSDENMKEILFTGCKSTEYSYDANYNGVPNGAFTKTAITALKQLNSPTYQMWYDQIRKGLPSSQYPQTPQFEGSATNKNRKIFS